jgi:hypothetical protein
MLTLFHFNTEFYHWYEKGCTFYCKNSLNTQILLNYRLLLIKRFLFTFKLRLPSVSGSYMEKPDIIHKVQNSTCTVLEIGRRYTVQCTLYTDRRGGIFSDVVAAYTP